MEPTTISYGRRLPDFFAPPFNHALPDACLAGKTSSISSGLASRLTFMVNAAMSEPDIHFVPAPHRVVAEMLRLAEIGPDSLVYDLGCGDGRVLIAAARDCGARGVGIEIDPCRIAECGANAIQAGVQDRIEFLQCNFFDAAISEATVIVLYLVDSLNIRLRPRILSQCRPGVRVVSYSFEMGEWEADAHTPIAANGVFLWIVPGHLAGSWSISTASNQVSLESLSILQTFQKLSGVAQIRGRSGCIVEGRVSGEQFTVTGELENGNKRMTIAGRIQGETIEGTVSESGAETPFALHRDRSA
jgi:SAM-dependent methyltransferase